MRTFLNYKHKCVFCFWGEKEKTNWTIYVQNIRFLPLERFGGMAKLNQKYLSFGRDKFL